MWIVVDIVMTVIIFAVGGVRPSKGSDEEFFAFTPSARNAVNSAVAYLVISLIGAIVLGVTLLPKLLAEQAGDDVGYDSAELGPTQPESVPPKGDNTL